MNGVVSYADSSVFDERDYPLPDLGITGTLVAKLPSQNDPNPPQDGTPVNPVPNPPQDSTPVIPDPNQEPCITCNQTGICATCNGTGESFGFKCVLCYGGKCWWCKGTGMTVYENSDFVYDPDDNIGTGGSSVITGGDDVGGGVADLCYSCHGSGVCASCNGLGYISNMFGDYSDRIDCGGCHGLKTCQRCFGTGHE